MADTTKIRIGLEGARELELDTHDPEAVRSSLLAALEDHETIVWVSDAKGNQYGLVTSRLAFVEIEASPGPSGVGFNIAAE